MVIEANTWHLFIDTSIDTFMVDESWIKYAQLRTCEQCTMSVINVSNAHKA